VGRTDWRGITTTTIPGHAPHDCCACFSSASGTCDTGLADEEVAHVGVERFAGAPAPFDPNARRFTFHPPSW
jgi:hypothetical protein